MSDANMVDDICPLLIPPHPHPYPTPTEVYLPCRRSLQRGCVATRPSPQASEPHWMTVSCGTYSSSADRAFGQERAMLAKLRSKTLRLHKDQRQKDLVS